MKKVLYHGEYIEIEDELEQGYLELDLLDPVSKINNLENTIEIIPLNIDDTQELEIGDISDK